MFKHSFFRKYLAPFSGALSFNVLLRVLSVIFNLGLLFGVTPFLSILFGQVPLVESQPAWVFSAEGLLGQLKYFLGRFMLEHGQRTTLTLVVLSIGILYFLKNLFAYWALFGFVRIKNAVVQRVRGDLYQRLLVLPLSFYSARRKGDLLTRVTSDVQVIDNHILSQVEVLAVDLILVVLMVATLFFLSLPLTGVTLVLLPIVMYFISWCSRKLRSEAKKVQENQSRVLVQTEEAIGGIKEIQGYTAENYWRERFIQRNNSLFRQSNRAMYTYDLASPVSEFLGTCAIMSVLLAGGSFILNERFHLSPEVFLTFLLMLSQVLNPAKNISTAFFAIRRGKASVRRIKEILNADEGIVEKTDAKNIHNFQDAITFQEVCFEYPADDESGEISKVLDQVSVRFEKNRYYAIVGPSGAGKSTLTDLIARFYDVTSGSVAIDGVDIRDLKISDVRQLSAYVSQETVLFNDTIAENLSFGRRDVTMEQIIAAAKIAQAHDFIMETENGYQSRIGDGGMKLSGGQRQRLSIARAVLKNAPILILDEATSALDTESEGAVQEALLEIAKTHTTIAIAHRLSTIRHADEIFVIDKGKIVERGNHQQLLQKKGLYAHLCQLQNIDI